MEDCVVTNRIVNDIEKLKKCWEGRITDIDVDSLEHIIKAIPESYTIYTAGESDTENLSYSTNIFSYLADSGIITVLCNLLLHVIEKTCNPTQQQNESAVCNISTEIRTALDHLIDFTDAIVERSDIIIDHPRYLSVMRAQLQRWYKHIEDVTALELEVIQKTVVLIFNMTKHRDNVEKLNGLNFKEALVPYFNFVKNSDLRLTSLAAVANLVDEEQSGILRTDREILKFLIKTLGEAFANKNHRKFGWSTAELTEVARRIAKNDENKRILVELGILHHLGPLAENGEITEQKEAVKTIKTLSFDDENRKTMIEDKSYTIVDIIVQLKNSSKEKKIINTCERILWTMTENLAQSKRYQELGRELQRKKELKAIVSGARKGHVMISYQWDNQELLKKVRDEIMKQKLAVWMDIDDMEGSILDAMAAAVENAAVVLICVSRRYKDSDNCRDEAHYAHKLKKPIIPLMMEKSYRGDGWLGFMIGTKLYFNCSDPEKLDMEMPKLITEIRRNLQRDELDEHDAKYTTPPQEMAIKKHDISEIKSWTPVKVKVWAENHGLPARFQKLTGIDLAFLIIFKKEVPGDFFYKTLMDLLEIKELSTLSKLRFALDDAATS